MADSQEYRRRFFTGNIIFLGIFVFILVVVFLLSDLLSRGKIDLTADGVYTTSPATEKILGKLTDKITVNYYSSEELPSFLQNLRRDTNDMFDEFRELSKDNFQYTIINPEAKASEWAEEKVEEYFKVKAKGETPKEPTPPQSIQDIFGGRKARTDDDIREERSKLAATVAAQQGRKKEDVERDILRDDWKRNYFQKLEQAGISAFPVTERQASSVRQVKIFSSIEIKYLDKEPEVIPFHYSIESLEYELSSRILKLTTKDKPVVAFFDGRKPPMPPFDPMNPAQPPASEYDGIIQYLGQFFDVRPVALKEGDSIDDLVLKLKKDAKEKANKGEEEKKDEKEDIKVTPEDMKLVKSLIVGQPDQIESRQAYEISRAVSLGIPTVFLVSRYSMDISKGGLAKGLPLNMISPGLEDVFRKWGIEVGGELLASNESGTIMLPRRLPGGISVMVESPLPVNVSSSGPGAINESSPLTNRLQQLVFPAATGFKLLADTLKKNEINAEVLAKTTKESWSVKINPFERLNNPFMKNQGIGASVAQYQEDLAKMKDPEEFRDFVEPVPLAVLLTGKMPFAYEGETIPAWKKEEKENIKEEEGDLLINAMDPEDAKDVPLPATPTTPAPTPTIPAPTPAPPPEATPAPAAPAEPVPVAPVDLKPAEGEIPIVEPAAKEPAAQASPLVVPTPPAAAPTTPAPGAKTAEAPAAKPAEKASLAPADGTVLLLASVDMLKNDFLMQQSRDYQGNIHFFQNALETFGLGRDLIDIRTKQLTARQFKEGSQKWTNWITAFSIAGVPAMVALFGIVYYLKRRSESVAYERRFIQRQ